MTAARARRVELLYFDGCPNHEALVPRLRALLDRADGTAVLELRRVESEEEARRARFLGSPTVRVDGRDVEPDAVARDDYGLKCRLYRGTDGRSVGLPPDELVLAALGVDRLGSGIFSGRPLKERLDGSPAPYRELHRRVLRAFLATEAPTRDDLRAWAAALGIELDEALAELQQRDVLWLDPQSDRVAVAYPFSGEPTQHRVELGDSGREVFAMCAVDALGIAFMANKATTVRSRDPMTGHGIEVRVDPAGVQEWEPRAAVVVAAVSGGGPSASGCCPHVNFASSRERAEALLARSCAAQGEVIAVEDAIELGKRIFGTLLHDGPR